MLLDASAAILQDIVQTGGTLAVLAFFLVYFMKEQKEVRGKMDALVIKYESDIKELRKTYDDKVDGLVKRIDDINGKSLSAIFDFKMSNDRLTEAVNHLTEKLHS